MKLHNTGLVLSAGLLLISPAVSASTASLSPDSPFSPLNAVSPPRTNAEFSGAGILKILQHIAKDPHFNSTLKDVTVTCALGHWELFSTCQLEEHIEQLTLT
ncbi:hypothetical protein N7539_006996 [Penicillium diatomitis]|uniref:Uncharacterized protein n=1 Tax=Penicillium diatomitis TaxID=2819901 RepID=A0A9X0BST9_9EURO|nr:uncharacterized protein N7539_006996 [Penicillium diatomitis]KAJ5481102.1 hypothetical protein N7539_006996 [Penicillium diatomitis]